MVSIVTRSAGQSNLLQLGLAVISSVVVFISFLLLCSKCWSLFKPEPAQEAEEEEDEKEEESLKSKRKSSRLRNFFKSEASRQKSTEEQELEEALGLLEPKQKSSGFFDFFRTEPGKEVEDDDPPEQRIPNPNRKKKLGQRRREILAQRTGGRGSLPIIKINGTDSEEFRSPSLEEIEIQPITDAYYKHDRSKSLGDRAMRAFKAFQSTMVQPDREEIMRSPKPPAPSMRKVSEHIMRHNMNYQNEILGNVGTIYFNLTYDWYEQVFTVYIEKAEDLEAKDFDGSSDPFVRVMLLPDKKRKMETKWKRKTLNPEWREALKFEDYPENVLLNRELYIQVLDYDKFSRSDPIGDLHIRLTKEDLQQEPIRFAERLRPDKKSAHKYHLGEILLSLSYDQFSGNLSVIILKCRNLKTMDVTGKCDPYVKIHVYNSGHRIEKRKTEIIRRNLNPEWNARLDFELPFHKIREVVFVFTVMDFDAMLSNKPVGEVVLGYRMQGKSQQQWHDMLFDNNKAVEVWHNLEKPVKRDKINLRF